MASSACKRAARLRARAGGVALLAAPAFAACTSDESGHRPDGGAGVVLDGGAGFGTTCPLVEAPYDREVSFAGDLVPFFAVTCAFYGCHNEKSRLAGLFLGLNFNDGTQDPAMQREIWDSLLATATTTDMPRVTPFEPSRSFLMLKVQGCQNAVGLTCHDTTEGAPCGMRMPAASDPLPAGRRSMLARWIAEGARFSAGD
jgi:hypothetical protein